MISEIGDDLFIQELKQQITGDVLTDPFLLGIYATDASMYQIFPKVVVVPKQVDDVKKAVEIANKHQVSILARGAGTSLAGQTVSEGMILDFSKYLNKIVQVNETEKWAIVEPGVIRDQLNKEVSKYDLLFAPDPATTSRANIGGMIANNAAGTKSVLFGRTSDHVISITILLVDGTILELTEKSIISWDRTKDQKDREGEIYRGFSEIVNREQEEILNTYPKVMRRVGGYCLDEFVNKDRPNLSKLICGSEGTLAIILEAKVNLVPKPKASIILLPHFRDRLNAISQVQSLLDFGPSAVELIDYMVINQARKNKQTAPLCDIIQQDPEAILITEFFGSSMEDARAKAEKAQAALLNIQNCYAAPIIESQQTQRDVWTIRRKGLGLLIGVKSKKKPQAFIEDAAIPIPHLAKYIDEVLQLCKRHDVHAIVYAHASVGVLHVRPMLDMWNQEDINKMKIIEQGSFELVRKYGGSWSSEHGDGLIRSPFNEPFYGQRIYQAFKDVKSLFDPHWRLNPGKIIANQKVDENLRYGPNYKDQEIKTSFHFREETGFENLIHMCSGVGECRKLEGTMCPSYMATKDEEHSTRGRANALRLAISGQIDQQGLMSDSLGDIMDLCLSCKACKTECPSNVDMAKLKSEFLQQKHDQQRTSLRHRFIIASGKMSRLLSGPLSYPTNPIIKSRLFRWILEKTARFDKRRILPQYVPQSFTNWFKGYDQASYKKKIILFVDTYMNYHDPQIGIAAVKILNSLRTEVALIEGVCCQRPLISNGFLKKAKKQLQKKESVIAEKLSLNYPILFCEPSCGSAFTEDIPDLFEENSVYDQLKKRFMPIEDYIYAACKNYEIFPFKFKSNHILLHGHCHQKSLFGTASSKALLELAKVHAEEPDTGCCGMAGAFGYEKEHYDISQKIGDRVLFKKIDELEDEASVAACGFSCRHQIEHFTGKKPMHILELFDI